MLSLVALVLVLVAPAASALPAESHEWYAGLRSPSGMPCCNERDCHPVAARVNHDTGDEEIQANGAWHPVEYGKVLPFSSPMVATMPAGATRREDLTFAVSYFPAWPPSPPWERSARISSKFLSGSREKPAAPLLLAVRKR
jgi:hypothetical protein